MIDAVRLRQLLSYSKTTGEFRWRVTRHKRGGMTRPGDLAGCVDPNGYIRITIDRAQYSAHRLAVLHVTGHWPPIEIDHRDRDGTNNRWLNLRDATHSINAQNRSAKRGKELPLGVYRQDGRFRARISVNGRNLNLGCFASQEKAHAAYIAAKRELHQGRTI
jgi:hypothetical protein